MTVNFQPIRLRAKAKWLKGLQRTRDDGALSDSYGDSYICKWQDQFLKAGKHCSFLCSIADWMDNVTDLLDDPRYDKLDVKNSDVLFRYYTKVLLVISEIIEDFVNLHAIIKNINKGPASRELESYSFRHEELKQISDFINSVCKHKTEKDNFHVHNHHLKHEYIDFDAYEHTNQIRINNLAWEYKNQDTTILMPNLEYFIDTVVKLNVCFDNLLTDSNYRDNLEKSFAAVWDRE